MLNPATLVYRMKLYFMKEYVYLKLVWKIYGLPVSLQIIEPIHIFRETLTILHEKMH